MNEQIRNQLIKIYNTMGLIHTSGEDTLLMADCLMALKHIIMENQEG
jgi:hypothetical protein